MSDLREAAMRSKAWPFEEARRLLKRYEKAPPEKGYVLFETGYGPSGLPHIGTFGEVARTTMIRRAFELISDIPTRLICFSDDMDGMRKVPENVPNQELLHANIQKPLTAVPDPFEEFDSFGAHNNAMLRRFLDTFGFDYEFYSATEFYKSGQFDEILLRAAEKYDDLMKIMLKSLREERAATYSIFLPIHPETGRVLYVPMKNVDAANGTVTFDDEDGKEWTLPVTGGNVKLQWKPDFGARWAALSVDFEMYGKDHSTNTPIYDGICRTLGVRPPEHFTYELFLDQSGEKISKSKGNGLSIDEWLTYASTESLSYFMYQKPKTAKRMHFDVIPKAMDEYHQQLRAYVDQDADKRVNNPVFHIHGGNVPESKMVVPFSMLLNLASAAGAQDKETMWGFIRRYAPEATAETHPDLDAAAGFAVRYYNDFVKPTKTFRAPDDQERAALEDLLARLKSYEGANDAEELQSLVFAVGKEHNFENLRDWFKAIYEVLLGQSQGPRFGGFIALYGLNETASLIEQGLAGDLGQYWLKPNGALSRLSEERRRAMKTLTLAAALWLGLAMGAVAQSDDIRQTIRSQLDAFKSDDFATAYDYASPTIKNVFRNPEMFGHMVQHGYPMVWRPGAVVFLDIEERDGRIFQPVMIEDRSGKVHVLEYKMIQIENEWQIDGVRLLDSDGAIA